MKEFLENTLHQNIKIEDFDSIYKDLPLLYRSKYTIKKVLMNGVYFVSVSPHNEIGLIAINKDKLLIEKVSNLNCVFIFKSLTFYMKERLIENGTAFI